MEFKDYYKILGLSSSASQDEIKRAYRELAKQNHPDANRGNVAAEARFKDISEAYSVLSNPEKRRKYDELRKYGGAGGGDWFHIDPFASTGREPWSFEGRGFTASGSGFSFSEILKEMFGFDDSVRDHTPTPRNTPRKQKYSAEVHISFDEAIHGTEKLLELKLQSPCPRCRGAGMLGFERCNVCGGQGKSQQRRRIKIKIPPGIEDGHVLKLRNVGFRGGRNGQAADVYVTTRISPHRFFQRRGLDIHCTIPVEEDKLRRGLRVRVQTIRGSKVDLRIPPHTKKGTVFRLPKFGLSKNGITGDQYVKII